MFHTNNLHILMQSYTFLSYYCQHVLVTVSYHHIAMLCFSYHVIYHIHFICVYLSFAFMFHVCINLEVDKGNYKGPKALYSLYETVDKGPKALLSLCETMTIYKSPKALLSLYETMTIYKGQKVL